MNIDTSDKSVVPSPFLFLEDVISLGPVTLPLRSTVIQLRNGESLMISPLPKIRTQVAALKDLKITSLVTPNLFHHLGLKAALSLFPQAQLWGAPGFKNKRSDLLWTGILTQDQPSWLDEVHLYPLKGMPKVNEVLFYHPLTQTLVVTDLIFNLKGLSTWPEHLIFGLFGTFNRLNFSRLFKWAVKDHQAFRNSLIPILDLPMKSVVVAHGQNLELPTDIETFKNRLQALL